MKNAYKPGRTITCIAGVGGVVSGAPVLSGNLFGVAMSTAAAGESYELLVEGMPSLPKATPLVITQGDRLYFNSGTGKITKTTTDVFVGAAGADAASGATEVYTKLSTLAPPVAGGGIVEGDFGIFGVLASDGLGAVAPVAVGTSEMLGRASTGGIVSLDASAVGTILGLVDPIVAGDFNINSVLAADVLGAVAPVTLGASTFLGRPAMGDIAALSASDARAVLNVSDGADATTTPGVLAAVADALLPAHMSVLTSKIGVPFVIMQALNVAGATTSIFTINSPLKFRVLDFSVLCTGANIAGTAQLTDGTDPISDALDCAVSGVLSRATTLDATKATISQGASLAIVHNAMGDVGDAMVLCVRVA